MGIRIIGEDTDGMGPDYVFVENFFNKDDLELMDYEVDMRKDHESRDVVRPADHGFFPNQLMSHNIPVYGSFNKWMRDRLDNSGLFPYPVHIGQMNIVELFKPWDTHNDFHRRYFTGGWIPYMNLIVPMTDANSRTIVFDQQDDNEDVLPFYKYKQQNEPLNNPVSEEFWKANCTHCWDDDRLYLTLKQDLPDQRRGQLTGIKSKFYHISDNFHHRGEGEPKKFIHVRIGVRG